MSSVRKRIVYKKNSQYIEIAGLTDKSVTPNVLVNDATGTATLYDGTGNPVTGATGLVSAFVGSGTYRFDFNPATFDPAVATDYKFKATLTSGSKMFYIELPVSVQVRKEGTEA
jgi:hypothetical protein